ncbi:MAG: alpha-amylase family glycosyl hydrolase [Hymenobacter sp.]
MPKASYHGYAVTDCYKIDPRFGTNAEYGQFVRAAHADGLKVVQDIVLNHWGTNNYLYLDQPAADWFHQFRPSRAAIIMRMRSTTRTARPWTGSWKTTAGLIPRWPT